MNVSLSSKCPECGTPTSSGIGVCPRCAGRMAMLAGEETEVILGDYILGTELGRGAMGVVYRARHTQLGRDVALKLLITGTFANAAERRRFIVEAESAARLDHPNLIALYEHGEVGGHLFHAMQWIDGEALSTRIQRGALSAREAATILEKCARAVHHAHERGVLHRDLKPGNVVLDRNGEPHVGDFGLARNTELQSSLTLAGSPLGTPSYMAPEIAIGGEATAGADIWSLGAMTYEMLTGRPPFTGSSLPEVLLAIQSTEPTSIRNVADRDLETVCFRCLSKDPLKRYRTALALADDAARWLRGEPVEARPVTVGERLIRYFRRHPAVTTLAALALIFLVAGIAGVLSQWRRAERAAESSRRALAHANESLWRANVESAYARRASGLPGQRTATLALIREAASYRPTRRLRDEAIAALSLPDIGVELHSIPVPVGVRSFHADGDAKNIAYIDGTDLLFLRAHDGAEWSRISAIRGNNPALSISADFTRIALQRANGSAVVDLPTGREIAMREGMLNPLLSADGKTLFMTSTTGAIEAMDVESGNVTARGNLSGGGQWKLALAPGENKIAAFSARRVSVFSSRDFAPLGNTDLPAYVMQAIWGDNHSLFIGVEDATLVHWLPDVSTTRVVARHDREGVLPVRHPNGLLVSSTSWDGSSKISVPAWGQLLQIRGMRICGFSRDGSRVAAVTDRRAVISEFLSPEIWIPIPPRGSNCRHASFSPDGRLLATLHEQEVALWEIPSLSYLGSAPASNPNGIAWSGDSSIVVGQRSGLVKIQLETSNGKISFGPITTLVSSTSASSSLAILPGNRVAFSGAPGVYDVERGGLVHPLELNPNINEFAASPDGRWFAAGCWENNGKPNSFAAVWESGNPTPIAKLPAENCSVSFSPDSKRIILAETNRYSEFETGTWTKIREWPRGSSGHDSVAAAFSPDGELMFQSADEFTLRIMARSSGEERAFLASPLPRKVARASVSPDGRWLTVTSTGAAQLWDLRTMRMRLKELGLDWEK